MYTKDQLMEAVRQELTEANRICGISEGLTADDYQYLGVLSEACKRIDEIQNKPVSEIAAFVDFLTNHYSIEIHDFILKDWESRQTHQHE